MHIRVPIRRCLILAAVVAVTSLAGCSSSGGGGGGDSAQVRVTYAPTAAWLPAVVADKEGIFKTHGLGVTLTKIQNVDLAVGALGKQFDLIAETPPGVIQAAARGIDITMASGNTIETDNNRQVSLLVAADSGIKTIGDLKGATIGSASLTAATHIATVNALLEAGVDPSSIRTVETPFTAMGDQLKARNVDAVELVQPFSGELLAAGKVRSLGDPLLSLSKTEPVVLTGWAATGKWASGHAVQLQAWRDSINEAISFIKANPEKARAILQEVTGLPPAVSEKLPLPAYDTALSPKDMQVWVDASARAGLNVGSVDGVSLVAKQ